MTMCELSQSKTLTEKKCSVMWANNHGNMVKSWVANGVVTQEYAASDGPMVNSARCVVFLAPGGIVCMNARTGDAFAVRKYQQIEKANVSAQWLCERGTCCYPWKLNEVRVFRF